MSAHSKATSRGMRRWWAKRKERQDITAMNIEVAIKQGFPRQKLPNLEMMLQQNKLRAGQVESLKKLMEKCGI